MTATVLPRGTDQPRLRVVAHACCILLVLAMPWVVFAENINPPAVTDSARILFKAKGHNFGTSKGKKDIVHEYRFENTGGRELVISRLRTTCKCMTLKATRERIPSGGKGAIRATLRTAELLGKQEYTIFVHSNDAKSPVTKLTISGQVEPAVFLAPNKIILRKILPDMLPLSRDVWLRSPAEKKVAVTSIRSSSAYLEGKVVHFDKENHSHLIRVSLRGGVPLGPFAASLAVYTDSQDYPKRTLEVTGHILSNLTSSPERFFFGRVKNGQVIARKVLVSSRTGNTAKVSKVETDARGVSVAAKRLKSGKYAVVATLDTAELSGVVKGTVLVWAADAKEPSLVIPLLALIKK